MGERTDMKMKRVTPIEISKNVLTFDDGYWSWFFRKDRPDYKITGKYLFFSEDRQKLIEIAIDEIEHNGFHEAKVNIEGKNIGPEYVLCLYYKDDSRKHELAGKYAQIQGIKYRYWKSDRDTLSGKYSEAFLSKLTAEQRKEFTQSQLGDDTAKSD